MDLLERYLVAVAALVPAKHRSDIIAELRSALMSQFEERQAEVGHPLTVEEIEALLKAYGHPVAVASQYRPPQPLIGPLLLPWYWLLLRVTLGICWITDLVIGGVGFVSGGSLMRVLGHVLLMGWNAAVLSTGTITIIALVLDRLGADKWLALWFGQIVTSWRPRDLPKLPLPPRMPPPSWSVAVDLIAIGLIVLWMTGWADALTGTLTGITHVRPAAIVLALRWPLLLIAIAQTALHVMRAIRAQPTPPRTVLSFAVKAAALVVLFILLRHWPWIEVVDLPPAVAAVVMHGVNIGLGIACGVLTFVTVSGLLWDVALLRRSSRFEQT